jgi:hypothetical protein
MGLPRVNFHRPWFKDVGNFDNEDQATIALEHRQPPCPSPLQFRVGHGPQELSLDDSEELLRMTRHARYAEVCAAQSATVPSATRDAATLEGIGELFRPLNERFRTMDLQFADDDSDSEETDDEDMGDAECEVGADGTRACGAGGAHDVPEVAYQRLDADCSLKALLSEPLLLT